MIHAETVCRYSKVRDQNNIVIDTDIIWVEIVEDEDGKLLAGLVVRRLNNQRSAH
eukprot:COSAG02_NODE_6542_length_3506_cov_2.178750_4_plen_55_part_00